jgi:hypothetical protein
MTDQTKTTTQELSLDDLARVSGAGIKLPDVIGPEYAGTRGDFEPNIAGSGGGTRGAIAPEI